MKRKHGWYIRKSYPHFDRPLGIDNARRICENPVGIKSHSFLPFISFQNTVRRFTPDSNATYKNKIRELAYCSHADGYIYSYYAMNLQEKYEEFIGKKRWGASILGYRGGLGSNLEMASAAFDEIRNRGDSVAIAIDISDFFPSVDHRVLLDRLRLVLGVDRLPADWFAIFKSMTRYSTVDRELIKKLCGDAKELPNPIADIETFRGWRRSEPNFIKVNKDDHGIPQGSPISAVFSNVYMIGFDEEVFSYVSSKGGSYRRYSDDILIIIDRSQYDGVIDRLKIETENIGKALKISEEKTEISRFWNKGDRINCDRPLTYLGLTFNGSRVMLKSRTLSRYFRRMTYATRRTARAAAIEGEKPFRRSLYRSFTHMGKRNFYAYAKRAAKVSGDDSPKRQLRRHLKILNRKLNEGGR